jgi:hypothetical protein
MYKDVAKTVKEEFIFLPELTDDLTKKKIPVVKLSGYTRRSKPDDLRCKRPKLGLEGVG